MSTNLLSPSPPGNGRRGPERGRAGVSARVGALSLVLGLTFLHAQETAAPAEVRQLEEQLRQLRQVFEQTQRQQQQQMEALQKTLDVIQYKCWYYDTACEAGTEKELQKMSI